MIKLKRPNEIPDTLQSEKVTHAKVMIEEIIFSGRKPRSEDYAPHYNASDVKISLYDMQLGKCCYCERRRDLKLESDVEHFRPKAGVTDENEHPGYWWLAYEWNNLLFSCKRCNTLYKKNYFPLISGTIRAQKKGDEAYEQPILIHPTEENPEDFISYHCEELIDEHLNKRYFVIIFGKDRDNRGSDTITLLGLDRDELIDELITISITLRGIATKMIAARYLNNEYLFREAADEIKSETKRDREDLAFRRAFFRHFGLSQFISED